MPRPTNKADLLEQARDRYAALQKELAALSPSDMTAPGLVGEWSAKDVLAHLFAWQQMALAWYQAGKRGENPVTPSEKYTWQQTPALNQEIYEMYRDHPLAEVQRDFAASHEDMLALIKSLDDEELFAPKVYKWTKSTTLGSYLTSATSSHYEWARKEIRKGIKARRNTAAGGTQP